MTEGDDVGGARRTVSRETSMSSPPRTAYSTSWRQLGREAPTIAGDQAKQLEKAVKSSSLELWAGRKDHLLRRLLLKADLGLDVPPSLRRALGSIVGAKVDFELAVSNPNEPVSVAPPTNPLPSSQLPGG